MEKQVERDVVYGVRYSENVGCGNTCVCNHKNKTYVILHGNLVGEINRKKRKVKLYDGGFQSNVTKSRLNCILDGLCISNKIAQRNRVWYLIDRRGEISEPFKNGIELSY